MALTVRYFSTSGAGAADGTTWADRAQLVSGATWSTVITGFAFNASDSMLALVGPGTHTYGATLQASTITNPPTAANPIIFQGCDSSGVALPSPDPDWTSDQPVFDDSGFPVVAATGNFTLGLAFAHWRCIKFTSSGRTGGSVVGSASSMDWCTVYNSTANTGTSGIAPSTSKVNNCYISMSGSSYAQAITTSGSGEFSNVRLQGVAGSSGNRDGVSKGGTTANETFDRLCIFGFGGKGFVSADTNVGQVYSLRRCVIANNAGDGIEGNSAASQTQNVLLSGLMVTGNGGYGLDFQATGNIILQNSRLRDNTSNNINTSLLNYPIDQDNYTTDSDDATEYVDASSTFDFRIKNTAAIWGKGYGVSDQPAPSGGGLLKLHGKVG